MSRIYDRASWRQLPRSGECAGLSLFGGACSGDLHLHHISQDESDLMLLCARHHSILHRAREWAGPKRRRCTHRHPYPEGKEACERRLNLEAERSRAA